MFTKLNRHLSVFLAAVLGVLVGSVGPGVARAAYDAVNAHKVDGFHAIGPGATANQRAGKLVAANTKGRAPDAERLNGYPHGKLRFLALPIQAAYPDGVASKSSDGVSFPAAGTSSLNVSFIVPRDHKAGTPIYMDVLFREDSAGACAWYAFTGGLSGPTGGLFYNGGWQVLPSNNYDAPAAVPSGPSAGHTQTFRWPFDTTPGIMVGFRLTRVGDDASDTCGPMTVHGLTARY